VAQKSIAKVPNQKVTRRPKCFSFFFFLFRLASSILCNDPFCTKQQQRTSPSLFHLEVSQGGWNWSL